MKTRVCDWFDVEEEKALYGFQVFHSGHRRWMNPMRDGELMVYETEAERDAAQADVRKIDVKSL